MSLPAEAIRRRLLATDWQLRDFPATGVTAAYPFTGTFSLGSSGYWHDAGVLDSGLRLWICPGVDDEIDALFSIQAK